MTRGEERRKQIWEWLLQSTVPITGTEMAERFQVSRQTIVADMATICQQHPEIRATNRGYRLMGLPVFSRVFKVYQTDEDIASELQAIVRQGAGVVDVFVYHKAYGRLTASLNVRNERDIEQLIHNISSGKSRSLLSTASGYHYHTVEAVSEQTLDAVEQALSRLGMLLDAAPDAEQIS